MSNRLIDKIESKWKIVTYEDFATITGLTPGEFLELVDKDIRKEMIKSKGCTAIMNNELGDKLRVYVECDGDKQEIFIGTRKDFISNGKIDIVNKLHAELN